MHHFSGRFPSRSSEKSPQKSTLAHARGSRPSPCRGMPLKHDLPDRAKSTPALPGVFAQQVRHTQAIRSHHPPRSAHRAACRNVQVPLIATLVLRLRGRSTMTLSCALRALESSRHLHGTLQGELAGNRQRAACANGASRTGATLQSASLPLASRASSLPSQRRQSVAAGALSIPLQYGPGILQQEVTLTAEQQVLRKIKLAGTWQDLEQLFSRLDKHDITPAVVSYLLFRFGSINVFLSEYQQSQAKASGFAGKLANLAFSFINKLAAADVANLLEGLARLPFFTPDSSFLASLSQRVRKVLASFEPRQIPLMLWAYASLGYNPGNSVLEALAGRIPATVAAYSAQNVSISLWAFAHLKFRPKESVLACLAKSAQRHLSSFKQQEIASCLNSFAQLSFSPPTELLQEVAERMGVTVEQLQRATRPAFVVPATPPTSVMTLAIVPKTETNIVAAPGKLSSQQSLAAANKRVMQSLDRQMAKGVAAGAKSVAVGLAATMKTRRAIIDQTDKVVAKVSKQARDLPTTVSR